MPSLIASEHAISSITIRNLDAHTMARLRVRAALRQRSMEEEVHEILRTVLAENAAPPCNLAATIGARFLPLGGVDLVLPARDPQR